MAGDLWFFDRVAPVYDLVVPRADAAVLGRALDRATRPIDRVLDLGGGTGRAAMAIDAPCRIVLDASWAMLREAPSDLAPVRGDARRTPIRDGAVDVVVISDALHHLPEPVAVLTESTRVLAPGGVLVLREFDPSTVRGSLLAVAETVLRMDSTFYTAAELERMVADAGLSASILDEGFACTVVGHKSGG